MLKHLKFAELTSVHVLRTIAIHSYSTLTNLVPAPSQHVLIQHISQELDVILNALKYIKKKKI